MTQGIIDILPGKASGRGRRLPSFRSRAMKPPAPLPTRSSTPPAFTPPPVPPVPVTPAAGVPDASPFPMAPVGSGPTAPVAPATHGAAAESPFGTPSQRPEGNPFGEPMAVPTPVAAASPAETAALFGTRASDPARPEPAHERSGLFGAVPAMAGPGPGASAAEFEAFQLRERSAIASEALSELSRLSGYRPEAVENRGQESMPRRTPQSTPGLQPAPEAESPVPHRERNATDVRSMLSGFRAGVERGRADQTKDH